MKRTSNRHMCVTSNRENVAPGGLKKIQNLVQTHSIYDSKAEECISVGLTKTGCGQRAPDYDTKPGGCTANYHIKPGNGWAPAQEGRLDTCWRCLPGTHSLPVSQGLCPDLTPWRMSSMTPKSFCGTYVSTWPTSTPPHPTSGCPQCQRWQVKNEQTQHSLKGSRPPSASALTAKPEDRVQSLDPHEIGGSREPTPVLVLISTCLSWQCVRTREAVE